MKFSSLFLGLNALSLIRPILTANTHIQKKDADFKAKYRLLNYDVDCFYTGLRVFVLGGKFNYANFEKHSSINRNRLAEFEYRSLTDFAPVDHKVLNKILRAKSLFQRMMGVAEKMALFEKHKLQGYELILEMMHRRVEAMSMYDENGLFDRRNGENVDRAMFFRCLSLDFRIRSGAISNNSAIMRAFIDELDLLEKTLEVLWDAANIDVTFGCIRRPHDE